MLAAVIAAAGLGLLELRGTQQSINNQSLPLVLGLEEFRGDLNRQHADLLELLQTPTGERRAVIEEDLRTYRRNMAQDLAGAEATAAGDPAKLAELAQVRALMNQYLATQDEQLAAIAQGNTTQAQVLSTTVQSTRIDELRSLSLDLVDAERTAVTRQTADAAAAADRLILLMGVLGLVGLAAAVALSTLLTRAIAVPITEIAEVNRRIADGDLGASLPPTDRRDEIGVLMQSASEMLVRLRGMTAEIMEGAGVLGTSVNEISATMGQLAATAQETATSIAETTTTAEEVRQTTRLAQERAHEVSQRADQVGESVRDGRVSVEETIAAMGRIQQQMETISSTIANLNEQSQAIGEIIGVVDDVADQVNILSVNASIEAARAGDEGKGFAVVAREIRTLADQSRQGTEQVQRILKEIQRSVGTTVMAVEQGRQVVRDGVRQSTITGDAIRSLEALNAESAEAALQIAATSNEQLAGMDQVTTAMEQIKVASAQNAQAAREGEAVSQNLHTLGRRLQDLMARYRGI
ncbi:MAG: methyl-accepting chemotaxis protein [Methanospirillum sp.]